MSVEQLVRDGRVTELTGIGKTLEEKLHTLVDTGDMKQAEKLRAQFPSGVIAMMHLPGFGPKRARRLYDELGIDSLEALRGAAERQELRGLRGFGPRRRRSCSSSSPRATTASPAPRFLLSRAQPIAEQIVDALRATPGADRVEVGRLAAAQRRRGQGPRHRRHHASPAMVAALTGPPARGVGAVLRRRRGARGPARRPEGRSQGRRARPVRQRAPALHGLQGPQRGAARGGRQARPARLGVRDPRRRDGRDDRAARPRRASTSGSACRGSRPSCARAAASWRRPRRAPCRS